MHRLASLRMMLLAMVTANSAAALSFAQEPKRDFTDATLESLGIEPVKPHKDVKTPFVIGGKNATASVRALPSLVDQSIAKLEKRMRPGADSTLGFLGKDESLLDVLAADNRLVVDEWGLSHQELARHLHVIGAIAARNAIGKPFDIRYQGKTFRLEAVSFRGIIHSPFEDETKANVNATVQNLQSNKKLTFSLLVPHMIERYGFYEGKGTPYRVDPRTVLDVLDFIRPSTKSEP